MIKFFIDVLQRCEQFRNDVMIEWCNEEMTKLFHFPYNSASYHCSIILSFLLHHESNPGYQGWNSEPNSVHQIKMFFRFRKLLNFHLSSAYLCLTSWILFNSATITIASHIILFTEHPVSEKPLRSFVLRRSIHQTCNGTL